MSNVPGARRSALSVHTASNVPFVATVRMEPSVTTSMVPVCVTQALKDLTARRDSAPQGCTGLYVTNTAPVILQIL